MRYFIFLFILLLSAGYPAGCQEQKSNNKICCTDLPAEYGLKKTPTTENLYSIYIHWAVGANGTILYSFYPCYYEQPAQLVESPTKKDLYSVFEISKDNAWAVGDSGVIIHWNGNKWYLFESPTTNRLNSVYFLDSLEGWAVGENGTILHYQDNKWSITESPTKLCLRSVAFIDKDNGWAVGDSGIMLHYNGNNWEIKERITDKTLYSVAFKDSSEGWAVGGSNRNDYVVILKYDREKWEMEQSNTKGILYSISVGRFGTSVAVAAVGEGENGEALWWWLRNKTCADCPKLNSAFVESRWSMAVVGDNGVYLAVIVK